MLKFLKNWTLPIAMLVGAIGYPLFISLSFLTPYLIFTMLLLTFCKVSPRDLKPKPLHLWLLLIQIGGALAAYLLLYRFDKIVAEGVMVFKRKLKQKEYLVKEVEERTQEIRSEKDAIQEESEKLAETGNPEE